MHSGLLTRGSAETHRALEYDAGLKSAGFGTLTCSGFLRPNSFGTNVTLGFGALSDVELEKWTKDGKVLSALFAANFQNPLDDQNNSLVQKRVPKITPRQKDVLCHLASGLQTARIAEALGITEAAVNFHFASARKALGAQTTRACLGNCNQMGAYFTISPAHRSIH